MRRLVPQLDVEATVLAELRPTPADHTVLLQDLPRHLQLAELALLQPLHTLGRLMIHESTSLHLLVALGTFHLGVLLLSVLAQLVSGDSLITVWAETQEAAAVGLVQSEVGLCDLPVALSTGARALLVLHEREVGVGEVQNFS